MTRQLGLQATRVGVLGLVAASLSSCFGAGMDIGMSPGPDKAIATSSVPGQYQAQPDTVSDEATVRNAVTSADISRLGTDSTIPWANTSTGSAGVVSQIREENNGSYVCRTFMTTRHSYQGVSNYSGKACLVGSGTWQLVSFREMT
jgi:hypothetical protein